MKKLISAGLILALLLLLVPVSAKAEDPPMLEDVVILYTNDIHNACQKEDGVLGFSSLAAYKKALEKEGVQYAYWIEDTLKLYL